MSFKLDQRIEATSFHIKKLELCELRLVEDGDNPWFLLIPTEENIIDWQDLSLDKQMILTKEIDFICRMLKKYSHPDKINVGSLGNMVPQMHVHIIARYKTDRAWPGAIWGTRAKKALQREEIDLWKKRFDLPSD